jgi:hypothetical protein
MCSVKHLKLDFFPVSPSSIFFSGQNPIKNATFCPKNITSEVSQERNEQDRQESDNFRQSLFLSSAKLVDPEKKRGLLHTTGPSPEQPIQFDCQATSQ